MAEPRIERVKTSVYFVDAAGVEWEVVDARRRGDGKLWRQYPGTEDAHRRYFIRYTPIDGAHDRRPLEVRRFDFEPDDTRWFVPDVWQLQLDLADERPTYSPPSPRP